MINATGSDPRDGGESAEHTPTTSPLGRRTLLPRTPGVVRRDALAYSVARTTAKPHSDRGSQTTSHYLENRCGRFRPSAV